MSSTQQHAVCITGLQRSYPEISHNIHYSLWNFYAGWPAVEAADARGGRLRTADATPWSLERSVAFFGVRPANDSWATVRTDLPPLAGESIQTPCGLDRAPWFSAYAKTVHQKVQYGFSFIQMMCDLRACHQLVQAHEARVGRDFETVARLRLDLAWETPLVMPPRIRPNTVYMSRMNTKTGVNDKWAIGRRAAMAAYLERVTLIPKVTRMHNRSAKPAGLKATSRSDGLLFYDCGVGKINIPFRCPPWRTPRTAWQEEPDAAGRQQQRRFVMTSEGFLMWALWRNNVSIAFEPSWMFCKFGNAVNTTARTCVPRMRRRKPCRSLVCTGGLTDCGCRNATCAGNVWYCEETSGMQLALDPYAKDMPSTY